MVHIANPYATEHFSTDCIVTICVDSYSTSPPLPFPKMDPVIRSHTYLDLEYSTTSFSNWYGVEGTQQQCNNSEPTAKRTWDATRSSHLCCVTGLHCRPRSEHTMCCSLLCILSLPATPVHADYTLWIAALSPQTRVSVLRETDLTTENKGF